MFFIVLADIKANPTLRHIPVIMLTSMQADVEVRRVYEMSVGVLRQAQ